MKDKKTNKIKYNKGKNKQIKRDIERVCLCVFVCMCEGERERV